MALPPCPNCPTCGTSEFVELTTPDYGRGAEFMCYRPSCRSPLGYEPRFSSRSPEARAISDDWRARSAANAEAYRKGQR